MIRPVSLPIKDIQLQSANDDRKLVLGERTKYIPDNNLRPFSKIVSKRQVIASSIFAVRICLISDEVGSRIYERL